jgi:LysR family glycine cleavage system transcriptional activator
VLELTETGTAYLPIVRDAFQTLSRGTLAITGQSDMVVQIHTNMSFGTFWLAPRLGRFYARHPDVRLNIMAEQWEPPEGIVSGADVEIRYSVRPFEGVAAERLSRDWYYPVAAPDWQGRIDTLARENLYDVANLLSTWSAWFEEQGLPWPDLPVTFASTYAVSLNAIWGGGICMAHDTIAGHLIRTGRAKQVLTHAFPMREAYYLITAPHIAELPGAMAFVAWLREEMAEDQRARDATHA